MRLYDDNTTAIAVASRKFEVVRGSGCYCQWHRRCKCYDAESSFVAPSHMLSQAEYTEAGFLGDVPPRTAIAEVAAQERDTLVVSMMLLIVYLVVAVAMGLLKAMSPYRSHWLWMFGGSDIRQLDAYKEPELRPCRVVQDDSGYYVHPVTKSRNVRLMNRCQEFAINALFFVNLPITVCCWFHDQSSGYYMSDDSCYTLLTDDNSPQRTSVRNSPQCTAVHNSPQRTTVCDVLQQTSSCDYLQQTSCGDSKRQTSSCDFSHHSSSCSHFSNQTIVCDSPHQTSDSDPQQLNGSNTSKCIE